MSFEINSQSYKLFPPARCYYGGIAWQKVRIVQTIGEMILQFKY